MRAMSATVFMCELHRSQMMWRECWNCDESGFAEHDCGDDSCCCLNQEPNVRCGTCGGSGGWYQCFACSPWED